MVDSAVRERRTAADTQGSQRRLGKVRNEGEGVYSLTKYQTVSSLQVLISFDPPGNSVRQVERF